MNNFLVHLMGIIGFFLYYLCYFIKYNEHRIYIIFINPFYIFCISILFEILQLSYLLVKQVEISFMLLDCIKILPAQEKKREVTPDKS